jgi:hypothetical protein
MKKYPYTITIDNGKYSEGGKVFYGVNCDKNFGYGTGSPCDDKLEVEQSIIHFLQTVKKDEKIVPTVKNTLFTNTTELDINIDKIFAFVFSKENLMNFF